MNKMSMRYQGRHVAQHYDAVRSERARWKLENAAVARMMAGAEGSVLDVACGTGRFFQLWKKLDLYVIGVDCSEEMLRVARKKNKQAALIVMDAADLSTLDTHQYDSVVCVRLLNLVDEPTMKRILAELCRVAHQRVVLTIRLDNKYVLKKTTAVHSWRAFERAISLSKWRIADSESVLRWQVIKLERKYG